MAMLSFVLFSCAVQLAQSFLVHESNDWQQMVGKGDDDRATMLMSVNSSSEADATGPEVLGIPENRRTYSSIWGNNRIGTGHARSMINSPQAWSAARNNPGQWMQIDIGSVRKVSGVQIQSRVGNSQEVTLSKVIGSKDGRSWVTLGHARTGETKFRDFKEVRYVRFVVEKCRGHCSMRADVMVGAVFDNDDEMTTLKENNFNDRGDSTLDPNKEYTYTLNNGYKCKLRGWTHTRKYAMGVLRNTGGHATATVVGLKPGQNYLWWIYQYAEHKNYIGDKNTLDVNGKDYGAAMQKKETKKPTMKGGSHADAQGKITFRWTRKMHHIHLSGLTLKKANCWRRKDGTYIREQHGNGHGCIADRELAMKACLDKGGSCAAIASQSNVCGGKYRIPIGGPHKLYYGHWKPYNLHSYVLAKECQEFMEDPVGDCWKKKDHWWVAEGHGRRDECYATKAEATASCYDAGDCGAVVSQPNVCGGGWRVTHGGPSWRRGNSNNLAFQYKKGCIPKHVVEAAGALSCNGDVMPEGNTGCGEVERAKCKRSFFDFDGRRFQCALEDSNCVTKGTCEGDGSHPNIVYQLEGNVEFNGNQCRGREDGQKAALPINGQAYTIEAWVKLRHNIRHAAIVSWGHWHGHRHYQTFGLWHWGLRNDWHGYNMQIQARNLWDGHYHHVVVTYGGKNRLRRMFVDGKQIGMQRVHHIQNHMPAIGDKRNQFCVGSKYHINHRHHNWNGWIMNLKIYNIALRGRTLSAFYKDGKEDAEKLR